MHYGSEYWIFLLQAETSINDVLIQNKGTLVLHLLVVLFVGWLIISIIQFFVDNWSGIVTTFWWVVGLTIVLTVWSHFSGKADEKRKKQEEIDRRRRLDEEQKKFEKEEQEKLRALQIERDRDVQNTACVYEIGRHGNETLALRYGIANTTVENVPYFYTAKGGVQKRNPARDTKKITDSRTVRVKKLRPLKKPNTYLVELPDYRDRRAIIVHVKGEPWIKTFLPLDPVKEDEDKSWYTKFKDLELVLKGNSSMTIKEIAKFHIEKTVN